jgi:hypothetical protein
VRVYALVTADAADEAVDVFLRRPGRRGRPGGCCPDEPESRHLVSVVEVELDERDMSLN